MVSAGERSGWRLSEAGAGLWGLFAVLLALPAHAAVALETRDFEVGQFHSVRFSGAGLIRLSQGAEPALSARGSAAALAGVSVSNRCGTLYIEVSHAAPPPMLILQVAGLRELIGDGSGQIVAQGLEVESLRLVGQGSGRFQLRGLEADELIVEGHGATRFELTGQVGRQSVQLHGTGAYQAAGLISNRTSVNVAGASDVRLWADERLDLEVAGTADIRYAGSPRVEQRITGFASVLRIAQIVI